MHYRLYITLLFLSAVLSVALAVPSNWRAGISTLQILPHFPSFHKPTVVALAVLSKLLYSPLNPAAYLRTARRLDSLFTQVLVFDERNAQAAIFVHPAFLIVIFRGSSPRSAHVDGGSDLLTNINVLRSPLTCSTPAVTAFAHAGFLRYADSLLQPHIDGKEGLGDALTRLHAFAPRPVLIAGHSLGGAAAVIGAVRIMGLFSSASVVSALVTFGQPRVVDYEGADSLTRLLGRRYVRVVRGADPVPLLPTSWRFKHAGEVVYVSEDDEVVENPEKWAMRKDRVRAWLGLSDDLLQDHSAEDYIRLLRDAKYVKELR